MTRLVERFLVPPPVEDKMLKQMDKADVVGLTTCGGCGDAIPIDGPNTIRNMDAGATACSPRCAELVEERFCDRGDAVAALFKEAGLRHC